MLLRFRSNSQRTASTSTVTETTNPGPGPGPDINELNSVLTQLSEIFPHHDSSHWRQAILWHASATKSTTCSRLEAAADILAHTPQPELGLERSETGVQPWERFRTEAYQVAVSKILSLEFNKLKESTIKDVLYRNNYDYKRSQEALSNIYSTSWRVRIASIFTFLHSKPPPTISSTGTGCDELDKEINADRDARAQEEQIILDATLARRLNDEQARSADALIECQCCFADVAWEDICYCSDLHYFCRRCLRGSVEASLYGQTSSLDYSKASVKCLSIAGSEACTASIPSSDLPHVLPPELSVALEDHFARRALDSSGIASLRCPFCLYAVVKDEVKRNAWETIIDTINNLFRTVYWFCMLPAVLFFWIWFDFPNWRKSDITRHRGSRHGRSEVQRELDRLVKDTHPERPQWDSIFRCRNPKCGRCSCLRCGKEWIGIHTCQVEQDNKKVYVARRMDEALKRTCPNCHTSFIKGGGCNKVVCPCGYKMCYLCRADLHRDGDNYNHFCPHFRSTPGTACAQCNRCSLFEEEVSQEVLRAVRVDAEEEWERRRVRSLHR